MTPSASDLIAGAAITLLFLLVVAAAELWRRRWNPPAEWTRKLVHVAGGLLALWLPLLTESHWVVLGMTLGMVVLFLFGRFTGTLQSLHGVRRKSRGTEYYPAMIYFLFLVAAGQPWKYFICVLVLTTADALAALVGGRFGRMRYEVDGNQKSVEGSLAFLVCTFLAVLGPLVVWPNESLPPLAACVLTALLVAILTTGFEAIAQHGRDNLWVPLGVLAMLNLTLPLPVDELARQLLVMAAIAAGVGVAAWRTATFNAGGALVLILAAYACWTLTSLDWALPVLLAIAFYVAAVITSPLPIVIASTSALKAIALPCTVMVAAHFARRFDGGADYAFLFGPFVVGCVTITSQSAWDQVLRDHRLPTSWKFVGAAGAVCLACLVVLVPTGMWQDAPITATAWAAGVVLLVGVPAGIAFDHRSLAASDRWWWIARLLVIAASMGMIAAGQWLDVSPCWTPQ